MYSYAHPHDMARDRFRSVRVGGSGCAVLAPPLVVSWPQVHGGQRGIKEKKNPNTKCYMYVSVCYPYHVSCYVVWLARVGLERSCRELGANSCWPSG